MTHWHRITLARMLELIPADERELRRGLKLAKRWAKSALVANDLARRDEPWAAEALREWSRPK